MYVLRLDDVDNGDVRAVEINASTVGSKRPFVKGSDLRCLNCIVMLDAETRGDRDEVVMIVGQSVPVCHYGASPGAAGFSTADHRWHHRHRRLAKMLRSI